MTNSSPPQPTQRIPSSSQPSLPSVSMTASATPETTRADFQCGASLMRLPSALAENYTLIEHLPTKGAEADIFLVEHRPTGDKSIAKVYRRDIECKPDLLERLRGLDSRHVVQIINHGKSDGHWFELMEYLPFGTLDTYLNRHTPHSEETRRAVLKELHDALRYLHTNGIFHRDLKPENILVREEDPLRLVFSDFGIASLSEASIRFTRGAGTLHYAAPEQIVAAATVTGKTDYWSLGMILFEMLAGRHPFSELGEYAIAAVIATGSTGTGGNLPFEMIADPKWRTLCQGLLVRDPQQRWGSEEVGQWLRGDATLIVSSQHQKNAIRPYMFAGKEYYDLNSLAVALAANWENAIKDFHRRYLSNWFSGALFNQELARKSDEILERNDISHDEKICFLLYEMTSCSCVYWKGLTVTIKNLKKVAREIIYGHHKQNDKIEDLFFNFFSSKEINSSILSKNKNLNHLTKIVENYDEFNKKWAEIITEDIFLNLKPKKEFIFSFFILAHLEQNFEKKLRNEIGSVIPEDLKKHPLIIKIGYKENCDIVKLFILKIVINNILDDFKIKILNQVKSKQKLLNKKIDKIKEDFPRILTRNKKIESKLDCFSKLSNIYAFEKNQSYQNITLNLNKLEKIDNIIRKLREKITSEFQEREVLYLYMRRIVEKYDDFIFKDRNIKEKFSFIQESEQYGSKDDVAMSFQYICYIENELQQHIFDYIINQARYKLEYFKKNLFFFKEKEELKIKINKLEKAIEEKKYTIIVEILDSISYFEKNKIIISNPLKTIRIITNFELLNKDFDKFNCEYVTKSPIYQNILQKIINNEGNFTDSDLLDLENLRKNLVFENENYLKFKESIKKKRFKSRKEKTLLRNIDNYISNINNFEALDIIKNLEVEPDNHENKSILNKILNLLNKTN